MQKFQRSLQLKGIQSLSKLFSLPDLLLIPLIGSQKSDFLINVMLICVSTSVSSSNIFCLAALKKLEDRLKNLIIKRTLIY
jgi:hypothetical protein